MITTIRPKEPKGFSPVFSFVMLGVLYGED
jgi:hypothetical protein